MLHDVCVWAFSLGLVVTCCQAAAAAKPNIVFIVADDLGYNDVSWHNPDMYTPHLESLAHSGVVLEQSYVQPICSPSRTAFMTGCYPFRVGRQHGVIDALEPVGVFLNFTLLPQEMSKMGYATHAVGKWHLGYCNESYLPTRRGFDSFFGYYLGAEDYYQHTSRANGPVNHVGYDFRKNEDVFWNAQGVYSTYLTSDRVEEILSRHDPKRPVFLYVAFQSVHAPMQVPDKYTRRYAHVHDFNRRTFSGMVTAMDEAVGNIVASLKRHGLYNRSLIVFTTDNGGQVLYGGNNFPLRGNKNTLWEGGTRGAAFVHGPMLRKKGYVNRSLIHAVDWFPTLMSVAGGKVTLPYDLDGVNQWPTLSLNRPSPRQEVVYNIDNHQDLNAAIRMGSYKLIWGNPGHPDGWIPPPGQEMTHDEDKINLSIHVQAGSSRERRQVKTVQVRPEVRLFDVEADPEERHDLASEKPDLVQKLWERLQKHLARAIPPDIAPKTTQGDPTHFGGVYSPGWCQAQ